VELGTELETLVTVVDAEVDEELVLLVPGAL
jgi:hypothetical protein